MGLQIVLYTTKTRIDPICAFRIVQQEIHFTYICPLCT
jgi:hypothetical protein